MTYHASSGGSIQMPSAEVSVSDRHAASVLFPANCVVMDGDAGF